MIAVRFFKDGDRYHSFTISGHAGYAQKGNDIVCAAVTSSVQFMINTFTEVLQLAAQIEVEENRIVFKPEADEPVAQQLVEGLYRHLSLLSEDYPQNVRVSVSNMNA